MTPRRVITSSTLVSIEKEMLWVVDHQQTSAKLTSKMLIENFPILFKSKETTSNYMKAGRSINQAPNFVGKRKKRIE